MQLKESGVIFRDSDHTYWLGDNQLSGITGILSKHLFADEYAFVPKHTLRRAAERGTKIHQDLFTHDMFGTTDTEEQIAYAKLKEEIGFTVLDNEYLVTDFQHFASAIDKVLLINGKVYLCDVKTTYKLNTSYISWQLSIYKYFFELLNPTIEISGCKAIWVRDGVTIHDIEEVPRNEVLSLLRAEINGEQYINPLAPTITDKPSEKALELIQKVGLIAQTIKDYEELKKTVHRTDRTDVQHAEY